MNAADVVETLPTAQPGDGALSAVRVVARHGLPGLVRTEERGEVVGCVSVVGPLRVALPRCLWNEPRLARVIDEGHTDRITATLTGARVGDAVGVPGARPLGRRDREGAV
ncbi:hypothetical protein ACFYO0_34535 [Streptomyces sp. NPDC006365]|uniref:hypothetical protein n=1 Tax=Streptomyces sp. NPDC006365 TaxID=3364744 RepID=UPI0036BD25B7